MSLFNKTWVRVIVSLLAGGFTLEVTHIGLIVIMRFCNIHYGRTPE